MGRGERYGCSMHREESKNRVKESNLPYIYNKHDTFRTSGRTHCSASRTILLIFEQIAVRSSGVVQKRRYDTLGVCKTKAFLISCPKKSEVWRKSRYRLATRRKSKGERILLALSGIISSLAFSFREILAVSLYLPFLMSLVRSSRSLNRKMQTSFRLSEYWRDILELGGPKLSTNQAYLIVVY